MWNGPGHGTRKNLPGGCRISLPCVAIGFLLGRAGTLGLYSKRSGALPPLKAQPSAPLPPLLSLLLALGTCGSCSGSCCQWLGSQPSRDSLHQLRWWSPAWDSTRLCSGMHCLRCLRAALQASMTLVAFPGPCHAGTYYQPNPDKEHPCRRVPLSPKWRRPSKRLRSASRLALVLARALACSNCVLTSLSFPAFAKLTGYACDWQLALAANYNPNMQLSPSPAVPSFSRSWHQTLSACAALLHFVANFGARPPR